MAGETPSQETAAAAAREQRSRRLARLAEHLPEYVRAVWGVFKSEMARQETGGYSREDRATIDTLVQGIVNQYIEDRWQDKYAVAAVLQITYGEQGYISYDITEDIPAVDRYNAVLLDKIPPEFDSILSKRDHAGATILFQIVPISSEQVAIFTSHTGNKSEGARGAHQTHLLILPKQAPLVKFLRESLHPELANRALRHAFTIINPAARRLLDYGERPTDPHDVTAVVDFDQLKINLSRPGLRAKQLEQSQTFQTAEAFIEAVKKQKLGNRITVKRTDRYITVEHVQITGHQISTSGKDAASADELERLVTTQAGQPPAEPPGSRPILSPEEEIDAILAALWKEAYDQSLPANLPIAPPPETARPSSPERPRLVLDFLPPEHRYDDED